MLNERKSLAREKGLIMSMQEFKPVKEGKVREVYDIGDSLIIVATDRISAFDVILKNKVEKKF
mgnify:FL=1